MSSGLSGSHETAAGFAREFNGRVHVVDNHRISVTMRQSVLEALQMTKDGKTGAEIKAYLEKDGLESSIYIAVNTLEYLKKGGRISPAVALAGSLLSIKPVIAVENGEVTILGKARGSKNGNNMLMSLVEKSGGINFEKPFSLAYSGLSDMLLQKYISDSAHLYQGKAVHLPVARIGSTIGTHAGPGAVAVAFFSNH